MTRSRSNDLTIRDIPQKENLLMISLVPKLYADGLTTSKQIASHFNQHVRHGHFFIHECRLLGWIDDNGLTEDGLRISMCRNEVERSQLVRKAVFETRIIRSLVRRFGRGIIESPDRSRIEEFLYFEVGLSPSTAKRRSSSVVAWLRYLSASLDQESATEPHHHLM